MQNIQTQEIDGSKYFKQGSLVNASYLNTHGITDIKQLPTNTLYAMHSDSGITGRPSQRSASYLKLSGMDNSLYDIHLFMDYFNLYYALDYGNNPLKWIKLANYSDIQNTNNVIFDLSSPKNIIILGDSISQGVGSSDFSATGESITCGSITSKRNIGSKSWAAQFVSLMQDRYNCTCDNNAISGINMVQVYEGLDDLITQNYDYAIIMIGTNDRNKTYNNFYTAAYNLINAVKSKGIIPFVFSIIDVHVGAEDGRTFVTSPEMAQIAFRNVCKELNCNFYPMLSYWTSFINKSNEGYDTFYRDVTPETPTSSDGLHPSDKGYALLFSLFREFLNI